MKRFFVILMLMTVAVAGVPAGAVAQVQNDTTATNGTGTADASAPGVNVTQQVMADLGGTATLVSYRYNGDRMYVTVTSRSPQSVTVVDAQDGAGEQGVTDVNFVKGTVVGEKTFALDVTEQDGQAEVTVSGNQIKRIVVGSPTGSPFAGGSTFGWIAGGVSSLLVTGGIAVYAIWGSNKSPRVAK
jgi:hypothetical protein